MNGQINSKSDVYFMYVNQFLLGFRATTYVPSINACMNLAQYSVADVNRTINFVLHDPNYLWYDYTFNVTQLISTTIA